MNTSQKRQLAKALLIVLIVFCGSQCAAENPTRLNKTLTADAAQLTTYATPDNLACTAPTQTQLARLRLAVERNLLPHSRAIARVHTEGTLPHKGIRDQSIAAEKDWPLMRELAQLWRAEQQPKDAQALSMLLDSWAKIYKPDFNPIDETNLDAFIDAYTIAHDALDPATQADAKQFIRVLAEGYLQQLEHGFRPGDGRWINNWNSHRIKLAALAAAALDDKLLWRRVRQAFVVQLGRNIHADGSTVDFNERDALHYVVYDLEPLVRAAQAARWYSHENWLTLKGSSGGSLKLALDWLVPYANGSQQHQEFVHSHVKFDAQRDAAGEKGYSGKWHPETSAQLFAMAAMLDTSYVELAQLLDKNHAIVLVCWPR